MTDALTADEAIALLRNNPRSYATPDQLRELAALVDADSSGRLTVLYSGSVTKGVWSTDVIKAMRAAGEDVRVINGSHAADFLESRDFKHAVARAHGLADPEPLILGTYRGPASDWLYHPTEGPWADASARFADKTVGEVRAIVSEAQPSRVFGAIEVPHVLINQNVTTIEGISRGVLEARQSTHGTQAAFEMIVARSRDNVGRLQMPVNYAGMPLRGDDGLIPIDSRAYFVGTQIEGKTPSFTTVTRPLADSMSPATEYVLAGQRHFDELQAQVAQSERALEAARGAPLRRMGTAVGLGVAASAYDAVQTGSKVGNLLAQDNPLAAQSALTHYGARGIGGWVGGAVTGFAVGWETGPAVIGFVAVGALAGSQVGENIAQWWDNKKIYEQTDKQQVDWEFDGRQWIREEPGDLNDDGIHAPTKQSFSALPEKARELNYYASNAATQLALGNVDPPRDPYDLPANDRDARSLGDANWKLDAQTGAWRRDTIIARTDRGHPLTRTDTASPERVAELEREAGQVIAANIAGGPAPIAARYELAYKAHGWRSFGEVPGAVTAALDNGNRLAASDNETYQRGEDGRWRTESGELAQANIPRELESTRERLRPALTEHARQLAAAPEWRQPNREELDRINLLAAYEAAGVRPNPDRFDAALEAVQRTRDAQGIDASMTSLYLEKNEKGRYDVHSPIAHLARDGQGVHVAAVTSLQEIELALVDMRGLNAPMPNPHELHIAPLSPRQRDAQEQTVREANRQGLSNEQQRQAARQAVAGAESANQADTPLIRDGEPVRVVTEPEPVAKPPEPAPVTAPVTAGADIAEPIETKVEVEPPAAAPVTVPDKPGVLSAGPTPMNAPAIKPTQDSPAGIPNPPTPQAATSVAADAAPTPDDGILRRGDRGQAVELLQYRLQRVGYRGPDDMPVPERGYFDAATEHSVRRLQRDHGLPDTGCVDPDTVHALALAQQAKIESHKTEPVQPATLTAAASPDSTRQEPMPAMPEPSALAIVEPEDRASVVAAPEPMERTRSEPEMFAQDGRVARPVDSSPAVQQFDSQVVEIARRDEARPSISALDRAETAADAARLSPADQAMFAKIRGNVAADVPDEVVARAMLEAKRNGIPDIESIGQVGVVDGKLWVGGAIPGFYAAVPANGPVPSMQDTLKETQWVNQQRDQQLAMDASQRQQDEQQRVGRSV